MPRGHQTSPEIQWIVIRLSRLIDYEQIAISVDLSIRSVRHIISHFRAYRKIPNPGNDTAAAGKERKKGQHLRDVDVEFLLGTIEKAPDLYLDELREMLAASCGRTVSTSTIWRTLCKAGFTMKKITCIAAERSVDKRADYVARITEYQPEQLVFVDESSVDRHTMYRGHAWLIRGTKAQCKAFFVCGRRFSVLPALSLDGIIHCDIVKGSFCTESFKRFIEGLLNQMQPFPTPNSVIVMDNCQIHKHHDIQEMIHERHRGMRCEFLPPYSPDYNPIKLAFSAMKYHLRCDGAYTHLAMMELSYEEIYLTLLSALYLITPQDVWGWFTHCGYL